MYFVKSFFRNKALHVLLILASYPSIGQWKQNTNGLYGGPILQLLNFNEKIIAGTWGGLYISTDNASNWKPANNGLTNLSINDIIFVDNTLYVTTNGGGVYYSTNEGSKWIPINLSQVTLTRMVSVGSKIYALSNIGDLYSITKEGGVPIKIPASITDTYSLVGSGSKLFLGAKEGLFTSSDGGATWIISSLTNTINSLNFSGSVMVAWTSVNVNNNYLSRTFISTDGGSTWTQTTLSGGYYSVAQVADKILVGDSYSAYISADSGLSWMEMPGLPAIQCFTSNKNGYYAGTYSGLQRSTDGDHWQEANKGITNSYVFDIAVKNNKVFTASVDHFYTSADAGATWSALPGSLPYGYVVHSVAISGNNLLAGYGTKAYISTNNGSSWNILNDLNGANCFLSQETLIYAGNSSGVYKSTDNGVSWSLLFNVEYVRLIEDIGDYLYIVSRAKIIRYSKKDASSIDVTQDLPQEYEIVGLTHIDNLIFCVSEVGNSFVSNDNGATWKKLELSGSFESLSAYNGILYAGSSGRGIYRSLDKGVTWDLFNQGISNPYISGFHDVSAFTMVGDKLMASISHTGIWTYSPPPLVPAAPLNLTISVKNEDDVFLHWKANTEDDLKEYIVYRSVSNDTISAVKIINIADTSYMDNNAVLGKTSFYWVKAINASGRMSKFSNSQSIIIMTAQDEKQVNVFPNPVATELFISSSPEDKIEELNIKDVTGREVVVEWSGQVLQMSHLEPGIYILTIKTNRGYTKQRIQKI